jgi:hypothetical protein
MYYFQVLAWYTVFRYSCIILPSNLVLKTSNKILHTVLIFQMHATGLDHSDVP